MKSITIALIVAGCMHGFADQINSHIPVDLSVTGRIQYLHTADLNSDGFPDIIVMHYTPENMSLRACRYLSIFLNQRGKFNTEPTVTYMADRDEIVVDWADTDADGILEILFLRPDGVTCWNWNESTQNEKMLLSAPSLFHGPDWNRLSRWPFAYDINQDEFPELLIPVDNQIRIYTGDLLGQFMLAQTLWTPIRRQIIPGEEAHTRTLLPACQLTDINGDKKPDLILIAEDRLDIFLQEGLLADRISEAWTPPDFRYRFTTTQVEQNILEQFAPVQSRLELSDLDQDGDADLVLSRASRAGFTSALSQLQIYNNRNGRFMLLPDQVLIAENFDGTHLLYDINRDGRTDAALLQFPIGLMGAFRYLFTRHLKYTIDIYLMADSGEFRDKPDQTIHCSRDSRLRNILRPKIIAFTDWNGDSRTDLLISTGEQTLACYYGNADGRIAKKPSGRIRVPISNRYDIGDFNQDGISDLILWHPGKTPDQLQCRILLSRTEAEP